MKQETRPLRRAAALMIAAAALPLTPSLAQDVQAPNAPPPTPQSATPPPAAQAPVEIPAPPAPVIASPPVAPVAVAPPAESAPAAAPARSTAARAAAPVRTRASSAAASRAIRRTSASTPARTAPAPAPATTAPAEPAAPVAAAPTVAPAPAPVNPPAAQPSARSGASILPWLVIALLLLGVAAFALLRRRRRADVYDEGYGEPAAEPIIAAAPLADSGVAGRPWLDLALEPVRAGVEGKEAVVEFALRLDNHGEAPARDVRVSAFMLQAGASEAERNLVEPKAMPAVTVAPGETKQVETSVALPTDRMEGDAVLPVVVADARYTLPDGSEGRTSASFVVGVPDGEELAHFAVDNPSGLHEEVVAKPLGEMEKA